MFKIGLIKSDCLKFVCFSSLLILVGCVSDKPATIKDQIKQEISEDGLTYAISVNEKYDTVEGIKNALKDYGVEYDTKAIEGVKILNDLINKLGLDDVDGTGFSISKVKDNYLTEAFFHMKEGNEDSLIWKILGGEARPLNSFSMLPESTILAGTFRIDLKSLYDFIFNDLREMFKEEIAEEDIQQVEQSIAFMFTMAGISQDEFFKAFNTEITFAIGLDKNRTMNIPDMPELPGLSFTMILEDNQGLMEKLVTQGAGQSMKLKALEMGNFKVFTEKSPLPTGTDFALAYNNQWMVISTDINEVKSMLSKSAKPLVDSEKFQLYKPSLGSGNNIFYLSREIHDYIKEKVREMPDSVRTGAATLDSMFFRQKPAEMFYIGAKKPNGFKAEINSAFSMPQGQMMTSVAVVGVAAAMVLPALGKARTKAKMANSKSNLKQLGITIAVYFTDGIDSKFPEDLSKLEIDEYIFTHPETNREATLEQVMIGQADYIILFKTGDTFTGGKSIPLAMERPGIWDDGSVNVVFQDGSVRSYYGETVEEVLNDIQVSY